MTDKRGSYIQLSPAENGVYNETATPIEETISSRESGNKNIFKVNQSIVITKRDCVLMGIVAAIVVIGVSVTLALGLPKLREKKLRYEDTTVPISNSKLLSFNKAVVVSDGAPCAKIGRDILEKGGSAVDAAIAALFCGGVVNPQSMGLGGGFIMTIYQRQNKTIDVIDGREMAPLSATVDMFHGNSTLSQSGGLAVAVPGELKGYQLAHQKYGKLNWTDLVTPSVKLCREGYIVSKYMGQKLAYFKNDIIGEESMKSIFYNNATGDVYKEGDTIFCPVLANTLEVIAREGADALYNGSLTQKFVEDIQNFGGIIQVADMQQYEAKSQNPISVTLKDGKSLHTSPPPGSGPVLAMIMSVLDGYNFTPANLATLDDTVLTFHRMIETFKYSFAMRTELGDLDFVNATETLTRAESKDYAEQIRSLILDDQTFSSEHYGATSAMPDDHGTAHVSVLAENGDAVSVTSTVNTQFGAMIRSSSTGIILNSEMDDFSSPNITNYFGIPPSPNNYIEPKKRPMSSMCPAIIVNKDGDVEMVLGGAGGTRIITATSFVASLSLWMGKDIKQAIDTPRIHHQLYPNFVQHEATFPKIYLDHLSALGHETGLDDQGSVVLAIARNGTSVLSNLDYRKGGSIEGY